MTWEFLLALNIGTACAMEVCRKQGWWDGAGYNLDPYETPKKPVTGVVGWRGPERPRGASARAA